MAALTPTERSHTMSTSTLGALIATHGIDVDDHLGRELEIPIHTGLQRQGDVIIIPAARTRAAATPVPGAGTPVVRGENGGNTHAIVPAGPVYCDVRTASAEQLTLATLTVPEGSVAYLAHPEHGYMGIGPGTYKLRRQREQADELRMVQD